MLAVLKPSLPDDFFVTIINHGVEVLPQCKHESVALKYTDI